MVYKSSRRLVCRLTGEYSSSLSIGATIIHPTHRFYRTFTKICLTFLPLTSRLCSPTARAFGEGVFTKSTLMDTKDLPSVHQLSVEELASKLETDLLPKHVAIIMDGNGR